MAEPVPPYKQISIMPGDPVHIPPAAPAPRYEPLLHVVLFQPEIPSNAGNIGRSCVAAGAKLWLVRPLGFEISDYYLRRAGLDYWEHLEYEVVENWTELTARLAGHKFWYLTKTGSNCYTTARFTRGDALVFGNESSGLPAEILEPHRAQSLRIPMRTQVRSLNLSNTAAILMYEALRQWGCDDDELAALSPSISNAAQ